MTSFGDFYLYPALMSAHERMQGCFLWIATLLDINHFKA